ncbi:MAG: dTDP-4-dehydrorhamnose reductase [Deltaproteobacteria bacterium]|jgi:dTDP-4-dehydrorhamnose reductase|nr:dTDP-4-dehydrorhamnose reductase [Deltaproteobacteria bacterium]
MAPKLLITGRNGQLGRALTQSLAPLGELVALGRAEADFLNPQGVLAALEAAKPDVVVNAAAWTKVDLAESSPQEARQTNALTPAALAGWAKSRGAVFVGYSTDYVFDGAKSSPYSELDTPNPLNVYGQTKLEGDLAVLAQNDRSYVFRTSWVYSTQGQNFPKTILRLALAQPRLAINDDQTGAPTSAEFLAAATSQALADCLNGRPGPPGLYNLTASGATTWLGFAERLLAQARALGLPLPPTTQIAPTYGPDPSRPAKRPLNSRLDTAKAQRQLGLVCPPWQDGVDQFLARLAKSDPELKTLRP